MTEEESKKFALVRHLQSTANAAKIFTLAQVAKVSAGGGSYADFNGATSITSGNSGLVPAPQAGEENYFLSGNGSWTLPTDTTYSVASTTEAGFLSAADKAKLDGIDDNADENAIEEIWIDGVAQTVTNKKVSFDLDNYAKKSAVASVWKRKGSVTAFADLPATGQSTGDIYNVRTAGGTDVFGTKIKAGDNVAWNGTGWDNLGGDVDLSGYVEKVTGKQLSTNDYTDAEKEKLAAIDAGAEVNVIEEVRVDNVAMAISDKSVNIDLSGKVDKVQGKQLSTEDYTSAEKTKLSGIDAGAEVNVIETVKVDGTSLTVTDKTIDIDLSGKVDKVNGKDLSTNDFTDALKTKLEGITEETITQADIDSLFTSGGGSSVG